MPRPCVRILLPATEGRRWQGANSAGTTCAMFVLVAPTPWLLPTSSDQHRGTGGAFRGYCRGAPDALVADTVVSLPSCVNGFLSKSWAGSGSADLRKAEDPGSDGREPLHVLAGDQHRVVGGDPPDQAPQSPPPQRIQTGGRLVEQIEDRWGRERGHDLDQPLLPGRQRPGAPLQHISIVELEL